MKTILYLFARYRLEARISNAEHAAAYCRAQRLVIEQSIAHHNENVSNLRYQLVALDHRYDINTGLGARP